MENRSKSSNLKSQRPCIKIISLSTDRTPKNQITVGYLRTFIYFIQRTFWSNRQFLQRIRWRCIHQWIGLLPIMEPTLYLKCNHNNRVSINSLGTKKISKGGKVRTSVHFTTGFPTRPLERLRKKKITNKRIQQPNHHLPKVLWFCTKMWIINSIHVCLHLYQSMSLTWNLLKSFYRTPDPEIVLQILYATSPFSQSVLIGESKRGVHHATRYLLTEKIKRNSTKEKLNSEINRIFPLPMTD